MITLPITLGQIVLPQTLYHGTSLKLNSDELSKLIEKPINKKYWRKGTDFSPGFYTTHLIEQTKPWAKKSVLKRGNREGRGGGQFIPCIIEMNFDNNALRNPNILSFSDASESWAGFILHNRLGLPLDSPFDIIIGYMADNNTGDLVSKFKYNDDYDESCFYRDIQQTSSGRNITMDRLGNQYAFCSEDLNTSLVVRACHLFENGGWTKYGIQNPHLSRIGLL